MARYRSSRAESEYPVSHSAGIEDGEPACPSCGGSGCAGGPGDCDQYLSDAAEDLGRRYAIAVFSASEAAREGDFEFAAESRAQAAGVLAEIMASPFLGECLESMHRQHGVQVEEHRRVTEVQRATRAVMKRPLFAPIQLQERPGESCHGDARQSRVVDPAGLGRAFQHAVWASSKTAVDILARPRREGDGDGVGHRMLDRAATALTTVSQLAGFIARLDSSQHSGVLDGLVDAAEDQSRFGVHEAWHHLHPGRALDCVSEECHYRVLFGI